MFLSLNFALLFHLWEWPSFRAEILHFSIRRYRRDSVNTVKYFHSFFESPYFQVVDIVGEKRRHHEDYFEISGFPWQKGVLSSHEEKEFNIVINEKRFPEICFWLVFRVSRELKVIDRLILVLVCYP